jgi:3-oxoacyl-(acyl-carrier-protein) synthase
MEVPRAAAIEIESAFEEAGYNRTIVTADRTGLPVVAIDMEGIAVIAVGDSDICVNAGRLSDLLHDAGQEAFIAGWEACMASRKGPSAAGYPDDPHAAWDQYSPSEAIEELQTKL